MDDIFDTNDLYPGYDSPLKEYFKDYFDSVFVALSPFFQTVDDKKGKREVSSAKIISLEELQKKDSAFKNVQPSDGRVIYTNDVPGYPGNDEIIDTGSIITWQYILENAGFKNLEEINLALKTSIGALRKELRTPELEDILNEFTIKYNIYHPDEGRITILNLIKIYNCLTAIGKIELVVTDEFFQDRKTINLSEFTCREFILKVSGYMYFFPTDRSLLFTIEWDSFFFLICGDRKLLDQIVPEFEFEGFFCTEETMHNWEL